MDDWFDQVWTEIAARPDGLLAIRFYLQPLMATFFAVRDGLRDAHNERPAYFWALFTDSPHRRELLTDGWKSVGRIFILAVALDLLYQLAVLRGLRPFQTLFVATLLAISPYVVLRGPINRIAQSARRYLAARGVFI
jgi:hypothetical protein